MSKNLVSVIMGSDSDFEVMKECAVTLKSFDVLFDMRVMSAHRTPDIVATFATNARAEGIKVIIAAAGGAAHLAGAVAAKTTLPVIGVPLAATSLDGMDALLATVQMPAGIPVATVAVGKAGAKNAALLALQILGVSDKQMAEKLEKYKIDLAINCKEKNEKIQRKLNEK